MNEKNKTEKNMKKYIIDFDFEIDGVVEVSDIVGAIFSSTDYLLGPNFDLRDMAKTGKIGRISIHDINKSGRKMTGTLQVVTTKEIEGVALIAALIETVEQVGPYRAKFRFKKIIDVREEKLKYIEKRAIQILENWRYRKIPKADEILEKLKEKASKRDNVVTIKLGSDTLAAGPDVERTDEVILVEGRADVNKLVKYGFTNVLSIGGGKIPEKIKELLSGKRVIAFLDGDRGGYLNLKKLLNTIKVDYIAMAPKGKEVEDLKYEEILDALKNKKPVNAFILEGRDELMPYREYIDMVYGNMEAVIVKDNKILSRVPISELIEELEELNESADFLVMDGIITQRLIDLCTKKGIKEIIGVRKGSIARLPKDIKIFTYGE
ncbi:MAG TPA: toprim domain-containing protein [Thermoprotei archaeon]|nr:toprim domain-containing protein [Thermoprotei archaeon]